MDSSVAKLKHQHFLRVAPVLGVERAGALEDIPKPWMLIDGLIPQGSIVVIAGRAYSGKTFLAMEAARAVATGTNYLDQFKVPEYARGNVLFIEQDSPKYDTGNAIWAMIKKQWKSERPEGGLQHMLEGLHFAWHPGLNLLQDLDAYSIVKTANTLFTHLVTRVYDEPVYDEAGDIVGSRPGDEEAEGHRGTKLIVLDSMRSLNTGKENESDDAEKIIQRLKIIRALTGATILLIHHTGAADERLRGSTAIEDGADCVFYVKGKKGKGTVTVRKARAIQPEDFRFEIVQIDDPEHGTLKRVEYRGKVDATSESETQIEAWLRSKGEVPREEALEWAALNGMSAATLDRRLKELGVSKRKEGHRVFYRL